MIRGWAFSAMFTAAMIAHAVCTGACAELSPEILDADEDLSRGVLTIIGENLGYSLPIVLLDGVPLVITSSSPTEVIALLPDSPPESFSLELFRGPLMDAHAAIQVETLPLEERLRRAEP